MEHFLHGERESVLVTEHGLGQRIADEHHAWPGCEPETDATGGRDLLRDEALPQGTGTHIDRLLLRSWAGAVPAPGAGKDEHLAVVPLALAPRFNGGVVLEGQMDDPAIARTHGV